MLPDPVFLSHAVARIDLGAVRANVRRLVRQAAPARLMAVVKADAYGHGAALVAPVLAAEGVGAFAVATLGEGIALRAAGVDGDVLVFAPPERAWLPVYAAHRLAAAVSSARSLDAVLAHHADAPDAPVAVHVKADTGMHRLGLAPADVPAVLDRLRTAGVPVAGVWTHLATAADAFAAAQASALAPVAPEAPRHVANSAALLSGAGRLVGADGEAWVRAGLALYGLDPRGDDAADDGPDDALQPVLTLSARVVRVATVAAGETVSYGRTWTAPRPTRVATVALGYADGLPRALSNRGWMGVGGLRAPIAGVVCMDAAMLDLGPSGGPGDAVREGDLADAIGGAGPSAHEVARLCGTIPYEILARIGPRVPRVAVG